MPVLSWINSNLTTNPNHMSKVSAQNGNWNKAKLRWVVFAFMYSFSASVTSRSKTIHIKKD
ncbi:hypothetical protein BUY22_13250 [Staphylococcus cohnii]|nr:hypothetical protein BUY22_13250 [Staphylococcus cohnii]